MKTCFECAFRAHFFHIIYSEVNMADRVAVISIIVENPDSVEPLNALLHEYGSYIIPSAA